MKISLHASSEPILISGLVGIAIDGLAINALNEILPFIDTDSLSFLKRDDIHNFLCHSTIFSKKYFMVKRLLA